jgi:glyoxylase-like metal-dependent hydrolase (beta-lactamase superfamily II)
MSDCQVIRIARPICNVFLIQGERAILVDSGRPSDAAAIEIALAQHGVRLEDVSLFLHTHGHWDHCGSTAQLRRNPATPVAIHRADAEMLRHGVNGTLKPTNLTARLFGPLLNRRYPGIEPTLSFDGELNLEPFGVAARIVSTPGHTAGSISVLTAGHEIIVGDLLMGGFLGGRLFPHRPQYHYFADDLAVVRQSIQKVLALKPRLIHVGHGGPLLPDQVSEWLLQKRMRRPAEPQINRQIDATRLGCESKPTMNDER